jgi:electron transport complex protein RnfG
MKKFFRDLVPLVGICLVAALLLAVFNLITEGPIAENAIRAAQETRENLLEEAVTFEEVELEEGSAMDSCYEGFDANGESVGFVVETTVGGYAGEIVVTVGIDDENVITGIEVGGENFSETAGLGAKAKEDDFTDQFIGETVPLSLAKGETGLEDGIIDAISGATITSTAVNGGVNSIGKFVMDMSGEGGSSTTSNFLSSLMKSIPPISETFRMAGLQIPTFLGTEIPEPPAAPETPEKPTAPEAAADDAE